LLKTKLKPAYRYEDARMHRDQDDDEPIQRGGDPYDDDDAAGQALTFE